MQELTEKRKRFEQFLSSDPENVALLSDLLECCCQLQDKPAAKTYLEKIRAIDANKASALEGFFYLSFNCLESAKKSFEAALSSQDLPALRYNLAFCCLHLNEADNAVSLLEPLLSLQADMPEVLKLLARAYHHQGQIEQALELAQQYELNYASDPAIPGFLAVLYFDCDQFEKAESYALQGIAIDERNQDAISVLTLIRFQRGEIDKTSLEKTLELCPRDPRLSWTLGLIYMMESAYEKAAHIFKKITVLHPGFIEAELSLVWCLVIQKDFEAAFGNLEKMQEKYPKNPDVFGMLAIAYAASQQDIQAQKAIKEAVFLDENNSYAVLAQALLRVAHSEQDKEKIFMEAVETMLYNARS